MKINDFSYGIIAIRKSTSNNWLFLLVQHNEGHWGFPKGHKDKKESDEETALREFQEETGINEVVIFSYLFWEEEYDFEKNKKIFHKKVKYFLGKTDIEKVRIQTKELKNYKWTNYKEALKLLTYSQSRDILRQVKKIIYQE